MVRVELYRWWGQSEPDTPAGGAIIVIKARPVRAFVTMADYAGAYDAALVRLYTEPTKEALADLVYRAFGASLVEGVELEKVREITEDEAERLVAGLRVLTKILAE